MIMIVIMIMIMIMIMVMVMIKSYTRDVVAHIIQARGSCMKCTTICPTCVDFRRKKTLSTRRKTLKAQKGSTAKAPTHMNATHQA